MKDAWGQTTMKYPLLHGVTSALLLLGVGCTASGQARYSASAQVTTPRLILIEPDIQVVADYDEPVFYTDSYYWRYDNGVWYRSNNHLRGWVRFEAIPPRLRRIERPTAYIRYRGEARVQPAAPVVRDHRDHEPAPPPPVPATPPPRDHRDDRKEVREDLKDIRKDAKEERKDDRKDAKEERKDDRKDAKEERKDDHRDAKEERKDDRKDAKEERKDDRKDAKDNRKDGKKGK